MTVATPWLDWLREAQAIAQAGLAYPGDRFDKERFARLREICAEALSTATDLPLGTVRELFCSETGFQTPKVDTRAFVLREGRVLLVREASGLWSLPGGWCEVHLSPAENIVKEAREEAGAHVTVRRLLLAQTYARHNAPPIAYGVLKLFFLCDWEGGAFTPNSETTEAAWFSPTDLPPLCSRRSTADQIAACFRLAADPTAPTLFDPPEAEPPLTPPATR